MHALLVFEQCQFVLLEPGAWDNVVARISNQGTRMFLIRSNLNSSCRAEPQGMSLEASEFNFPSQRLAYATQIASEGRDFPAGNNTGRSLLYAHLIQNKTEFVFSS